MLNLFKRKQIYKNKDVVHFSNYQSHIHQISNEDYFNLWCDFPAMKTCDWFKSIPLNKDVMRQGHVARKNVNLAKLDAMYRNFRAQNSLPSDEGHITNTTYIATARMCPAIVNTLAQSIAVKAPVDIHVSVVHSTDSEPKVHHVFTDHRFGYTHGHSRLQFTSDRNKLLNGFVNFKIETGLSLHCHKDTTIIFSQPVFHNPSVPYTVIPGSFTYPINGMAPIIFNAFMPEDTKDFIIRRGEVLFYITFNKKVKLLPTSDPKNRTLKTTLYKARQTIRSALDE